VANAFDKLGRRDEKIRHLEEVIRYKEDFANAYLMLGKSYLDSNRELARAVELTQKGLALAPTSEFALFDTSFSPTCTGVREWTTTTGRGKWARSSKAPRQRK
jgi:tetratricopeptide (TPR) repeat protein